MACGKLTFLTALLTICAFFHATEAAKKVIELNEDNWRLMLNKEWMVEFYAPWCPACKGLQGVWNDFASWSDELGISVAQVDVTTSPGLSGRFMVTALPTIFHVIDGEFRQYKGSRDKDSFMSFVEERKWKSVEAVPGWQSPDSVQMSVVSAFFKFSQVLRQLHGTLMDDYGLPSWGSYLIFSIATILLGAVLGLMLVCVIDLVYPQRYPRRPSFQQAKDKESDDEDELADEDIKDDLVDDASQSEQELDKYSSTDTEAEASPKGSPGSPSLKKRRAVFSHF